MARDRLLWPAVLAEDLLHATYEQAKSSAADLGSEKNEIASEANVDKYGGAAPKADFTLDQHGVAELRRRARTNGNKRGTNARANI